MKTNQYLSLLIICFITLACNKKLKPTTDPSLPSSKATYLLIATTMFQDEDASIDLQKNGQILKVVRENENILDLERDWNKRYYNNLLHHYIPSPEEHKKLNELLGTKASNLNELTEAWPIKLSDQLYEDIFKLIKKKFLRKRPIDNSLKNKYTIVVNPKFWTFSTQTGYPLLVDIISTYDRDFENYELFHDTEDSAWNYGTIIFERLCNNRNPDNPYYYNKLTIDQFNLLSPALRSEFETYNLNYYEGLPLFRFNAYSKTRTEEYTRILSNNKNDLLRCKNIFSKLPTPPFFIEKLD